MTSIEFIDKEIASYKHLVAFSSNDQKKYYEECVSILQQIKIKLEAWEAFRKWLNKYIEFYEHTIELVQRDVDNYDKLTQGPLDPMLNHPKEYYIKLLNSYKYTLNIYQQIKTELEAWYICKQNAHINKYENINKKRKENRFDITIWLNTENCGFKSCASYEDCLKVRKALEVKDE